MKTAKEYLEQKGFLDVSYDLHLDVIECLLEEYANQSKWISVEDELPPKSKNSRFSISVIGTDGESVMECHMLYVNNKWYDTNGNDFAVKLWQPLPEKP